MPGNLFDECFGTLHITKQEEVPRHGGEEAAALSGDWCAQLSWSPATECAGALISL